MERRSLYYLPTGLVIEFDSGRRDHVGGGTALRKVSVLLSTDLFAEVLFAPNDAVSVDLNVALTICGCRQADWLGKRLIV
jgi:hypothetical protein